MVENLQIYRDASELIKRVFIIYLMVRKIELNKTKFHYN